ncbi:MAG: DNA-directed RNA polymerase subunit beta' [Candidatus Kerfeldbacteria bacterium RIFCSPHIGHO2_02_FULL_42_14]|uniref:DNA-directed RNA polymerase subunit beta' n=1 Tax=Candidatus Kerfeldbacteria bacterium RIFCSPHIGHO2_02_FULL_42_14 TaxID=1798540 RepID=A0A1G2ASU9_9BACT|nr:MAG: DNA-directed RNA polymerase subunit beta' [Candidatus Kerfeldbacteria bacterium RIFCSPHIGHO2_02_FULL_42_14]OGY81199.1 MAG: DNA-directed RNA polymerase subunit beta' [Candidatus Kerfeldbacteria bacterium RIFCSPHIGHO2_12_FULL_42_13]OGY83381.1 MAG: DNA-directed RNA polymerase subunit beta' [Candidatus Kerfeldbacteria bacterium RIFCSPLOWO2_02_FULL_42_19]OGY85496.1 MAG: DNA-directed RNA polymerase subunit beta' [Candidatus Kerfeldbacteria bacterium RIFCSPLOWO2_12_FULL_43_9]
MLENITLRVQDFKAIRLKLASPDEILDWSHGEVTRPETINYRTQRPERDGLFCERIFGPSKDWECYCGKYKRIRYKGIVCDKCGVEVTRSVVRRERMGHIQLAAPVSHIWFLRGVPSKIGFILDLSVQALEKVIYFANFIITNVDETLKEKTLVQIYDEAKSKRHSIQGEYQQTVQDIEKRKKAALHQATGTQRKTLTEEFEQELINAAVMRDEKLKDLDTAVDLAKKELKNLESLQILSESEYQDLSLKYGHVFEASIGAEAIRKLLEHIDLDKLTHELAEAIIESAKNQKRRLVRRLKFVRSLRLNNIRPDWMILTMLPVIPPDLRPMVQLDGGRFAASDLNDLYRRVINRNNRLKRLQELNAPEVIQRNEKRMLQEAVDALIDNSARHGKTVTASTGQKRQLKSLADMLKGKQGRFRQNLLGKRVDYSGRSVIVVGPHLKLHQCGLPKTMALELFKPFVMSELIKREIVYNVRSANRFIESGDGRIWDILEEITKKSYVLLNRAPTLHRLGIQAFQPILIEGKAIQIHPLVCTAFNADFDGDQMAVHIPLTAEAQKEAAQIMLSSKNLLKPATGDPVVSPSQDLVLGVYYMTTFAQKERAHVFESPIEALNMYALGHIGIQTRIRVRIDQKIIEDDTQSDLKKGIVLTSVGRILFNQVLPESMQFINKTLDKKGLRQVIAECLRLHGRERTVELLDAIKMASLTYLTSSGLSWGMDDLMIPKEKTDIVSAAEKEVDELQSQYDAGLLTDEERHARIVAVWTRVKNDITDLSQKTLDPYGSVYAMINSGSRGSWGQTTQMMGMKGLVVSPSGSTIELPVKRSFKEGFDVLEYFISTHGARKGLTDIALRTANAGYLTRRLVDVAQDVVVIQEDCGDRVGITWRKEEVGEMGPALEDRVIGRVLAKPILHPKTKKEVLKAGELVTSEHSKILKKLGLKEVTFRSVLTCKTLRGICQQCYGYDLGHNTLVALGTAVGIIAAQSIGEPGTQLTMRTFHTGGVAGADITQGLPRVEELFEARPIKSAGILSEVDGEVLEVKEEGKQKTLVLRYSKPTKQVVTIAKGDKVEVKDGDQVRVGDILLKHVSENIPAHVDGNVKIENRQIMVFGTEEKVVEYALPIGFGVKVGVGDLVTQGMQLSEGSLDLHQLYLLRSKLDTQKYIIKEIQYIYASQGQDLNDKHLEAIVRQMFSRYYIKDARDTDMITGDIVALHQIIRANQKVKTSGGKEALTEPLLLGITKVSLSTDSFLAAASFIETAKVLIDAAISGKVDDLSGLKENVIIGKLIPVGTGFVPPVSQEK